VPIANLLAKEPFPNLGTAPEWVEMVKKELVAQKGKEAVEKLGAEVRTTLDVKLQESAQAALQKGLRASDARNKCERKASILQQEAAALLTAGAGLMTWGAIMTAQSKHTERRPLPDVQTVQVRPSQPCGNVAALEGMSVAVLLPRFGGKWAGHVNADGSARIELPGKLTLPQGATVSVFVDSVPEALSSLVAPGSPLAQVTLN